MESSNFKIKVGIQCGVESVVTNFPFMVRAEFRVIGSVRISKDQLEEHLALSPYLAELESYCASKMTGSIFLEATSFARFKEFEIIIGPTPFAKHPVNAGSICLTEYYSLLRAHDWHFSFSDDKDAYRLGSNERNMLEDIAKSSFDHTALFDAYLKFKNSGPSWGTSLQAEPMIIDGGIAVFPVSPTSQTDAISSMESDGHKPNIDFVGKDGLLVEQGHPRPSSYDVIVQDDLFILAGAKLLTTQTWKPDWQGNGKTFKIVGESPTFSITSSSGPFVSFGTEKEAVEMLGKITVAIAGLPPEQGSEDPKVIETTTRRAPNNYSMVPLLSNIVAIFSLVALLSTFAVLCTDRGLEFANAKKYISMRN